MAGVPTLHTARGSHRAEDTRAEQQMGTGTAFAFPRFACTRKGHCSEDVPCVIVLPRAPTSTPGHRDSPQGSCSTTLPGPTAPASPATQHSPTYLGESRCAAAICKYQSGTTLNSSLGCCGLQPPDYRLATGSPGLGQVGVPVCPPRGLGSNPDWFSSFSLPVGISPAEEMAQLAHSTAGASRAATWQCRRKTSSDQVRHIILDSPFLTQMLLKCSS